MKRKHARLMYMFASWMSIHTARIQSHPLYLSAPRNHSAISITLPT